MKSEAKAERLRISFSSKSPFWAANRNNSYPAAYHPVKRGYDSFYGLLQGSRSYFPLKKQSPHQSFLRNEELTPEGGYTTDRIGDGACDFIRPNKEKPFFLFVSFTAPHGPLQAKPEVLEAIGKVGNPKRTKYAGLVKSLDDNCGKTHDSPVIALDWFPTFVEAAGNKVESDWKLDGTSLLPVLKDPAAKLPERALYWRTSGSKGPIAIREGDWKLIKLRGKSAGGAQLYNLKDDIAESKDLAAAHPDKVKALEEKLKTWESELIEPLW